MALALLLPLGLGACDADDDLPTAPEPEAPTIASLAAETSELSTLYAALQAAGLTATLESDGPLTVFAPVNAAFAELGEERIGRLLAEGNQALLSKVLTYHVVPGEVLAGDLTDGAILTTAQGGRVQIELDGGVRVNGARFIAADIRGSNGVVHLIDGVLTDNLDLVDVAVLEGFDALVGAVRAADLEETLRTDNGGEGFTVFAPTNAAFQDVGELPSDADVVAGILLYHGVSGIVPSTALSEGQVVTTLQGGTLTVDLTGGVSLRGAQNDADVVATDVPAANGLIHVIDAVLLPPQD